jgi:FkbM family methyltransferase
MAVDKGAASLDLPFKVRWKLLRQDALAALNIGGHRRVRMAPHPLGVEVIVDDGRIVAPSPMRWKLYRKGWNARIDQLADEYGVGRHVKLNADSIILDIGANAGEFAHVAAQSGARIFCLEPDPATHACLRENIAALPGATAHDALVWKEEAEVPFTSVPALADSSVFAEDGPRENRRATTVEAFCRDNAIAHIDLLKCDAEGAEPEVLQGVGTMFPNIQAFALDTGRERRGARTNSACKAILEANGFRAFDETIGKRLMTFGLRSKR